MSNFIKLRIGKNIYDKYIIAITNVNRIHEVVDRPGYKEPMCTILLDMGTKGHWQDRGANSVWKSINVYHSMEEMEEMLCLHVTST